jgi:hypothetical protein
MIFAGLYRPDATCPLVSRALGIQPAETETTNTSGKQTPTPSCQ